jgi:hypothetical protein
MRASNLARPKKLPARLSIRNKDLTEAQFTALAQILRLRQGSTREAVRQHLVQGLRVPDAARATGVDYQLALKAVYRVKAGLALIKKIAD